VKAVLFLDGGTSKVPPSELRAVVRGAGIEVASGRGDFGIVVGGDGRFSRYGRTEDIPLLFVGVRTKGATGSRAHLAQVDYWELPEALTKIRAGRYSVVKHKRLEVLKNERPVGEVFTDTYLQRGGESTCIRYRVEVSGRGAKISEAAVGDGVVVTTKSGSTGYYSYVDRIKGEQMDPSAFATLGEDEIGICHISPTYTEREGTGAHPLRYRVPWGSKIDLSLFRKADARLYGVSTVHEGLRVELGDKISVVPGKKTTNVVSLDG
jgi:hypothetical protein